MDSYTVICKIFIKYSNLIILQNVDKTSNVVLVELAENVPNVKVWPLSRFNINEQSVCKAVGFSGKYKYFLWKVYL